MTITLNGMLRSFDKEMSVAELLCALEIASEGTAVAVNASVVPRKQHGQTYVREGDTVEIIRAVAGG
ncbi:MAG: sulfur carrier protein ThiS [candidate division Zixibacteria bacterium]|nr:sulfur carrier protein ThiS [candidate division Zixibacteria bacterium]